MGILSWIILGGLAGWMATMLTGTSKSFGIFANIVIGMVGAMLGGFIVAVAGGVGVTGFNIWSFLVATGGAVVLLALVKSLSHLLHY
jgi:uncharacterized membrane protein YeaQ/YmgE (transglycosylase-associated protein family)